MQPVACRVTHGIYPAVEVGVRRGVVEELEEDAEDGLGVGLGADANVVFTDGGEGNLKGC